MLPLDDGGGGGGGGDDETVPTETLSNVAVFNVVVSWLVTINPMFALAGAKVVVPSAVHVEPFAETEALTVVPLLESFSHAGGACDPYVISVVAAPVDDRVMNSIVPLGVTSRITWADVAETDSRIMTPAFAHACVFCSE